MQHKTTLERKFLDILRGCTSHLISKFLLSLLFMGLMMTKVKAQQIDYISSLRINQPYSANLADYANPMSQRMLLTLRYATGDGTVSNVRLKMFLERGNNLVAYSSDVVSGASNINLTVNVTEQITMDRLAPYFRLENLQGISPETYNRPLPDGIYRVTFEVYEVLTNRKVASASQQMWVTLNEPPVLNAPRNGEMMQFNSSGQNINFQWIPRAIQGGISEYEFTLIELIDNGVSPYQQLLTNIPTFQTTTTATQLSYFVQGGNGGGGIGGLDGDGGGGGMGMGFDPPLSPGVKYAWRVRAKAPAGATNVGYYKNDGYSDVFVFKYGGTCVPPTGLDLAAKSYDQISVKWTASQEYSGYKVAYRKYSPDVTWQWVEQATSTNFYTLSGLEANTAYEVKVGGICSSDMISYTEPQTVTTMAAGQTAGVNCGIPPTLDIASQTPIASLGVNTFIYANDFPITLTQVTGGNGVFSGEGYVGFPFLNIAKIRVKFTNITVNQNRKLISGFVETAYDPTWSSGIADVDQVINEIKDFVSIVNDLINSLINKDYNQIAGLVNELKKIANNELPESLVTLLNTATNNLINAKTDYDKAVSDLKNASNDAEKAAAQARLNDAENRWKAAQDALKNVLAQKEELIKKFGEILKKALLELHTEIKDKEKDIRTKIEESKTTLRKYDLGLSISDSENSFNNLIFLENYSETITTGIDASLVTEFQSYFKNKQEAESFAYIKIMYERFNTSEKIDLLGKAVRGDNDSLIKEILKKQTENAPERGIIDFIKLKIKKFIENNL